MNKEGKLKEKPSLKKRLKSWMLIHLTPLPGALFVKILYSTLKVRHLHGEIPEAIHGEGSRYIMAFWHGTLLMMVKGYVGEKLTFLVSWHRDGEIVSRVMKYFGMVPTRGSTTHGGLKALQQLLKRAKEGFDIAFTPDGPKGPAESVQMGMIQTARLSGLPIVPFGFAARKKKRCAPGTPSRFPCPSPASSSAAASL
jgi:lysophospholipid acyltransferase (LPLAT)-like uncharacterized protein